MMAIRETLSLKLTLLTSCVLQTTWAQLNSASSTPMTVFGTLTTAATIPTCASGLGDFPECMPPMIDVACGDIVNDAKGACTTVAAATATNLISNSYEAPTSTSAAPSGSVLAVPSVPPQSSTSAPSKSSGSTISTNNDGAGYGQFCGSGSSSAWMCQSANPPMQQAPSFVQAATCLCLVQSTSAITPAAYYQGCITAGGFPVDIRNSPENQVMGGFVNQVGAAMQKTLFPVWIGLVKNANGVDIWNDQCTNSTASAYANYGGGSSSTITGAAYSMLNSETWQGNTPDASPGMTYGLCRKDMTPCGRNLCQSGSTCVANGNCFSCTCPTGYTGQYCEKGASAGASPVSTGNESTSPPPMVATLPSCSSAAGLAAFPDCIPDEIQTGCDNNDTAAIPTMCGSKTATTKTPAAAPPAANPNNDTTAPITKSGDCGDSWIQRNYYWVILLGFSCGILIVACIGLIYTCCCREDCRDRPTVAPVYPMHEPPPPVLH